MEEENRYTLSNLKILSFFFCNREKKIGTGVEVTIIYTANALY